MLQTLPLHPLYDQATLTVIILDSDDRTHRVADLNGIGRDAIDRDREVLQQILHHVVIDNGEVFAHNLLPREEHNRGRCSLEIFPI